LDLRNTGVRRQNGRGKGGEPRADQFQNSDALTGSARGGYRSIALSLPNDISILSQTHNSLC
jgi:hypothetical protein